MNEYTQPNNTAQPTTHNESEPATEYEVTLDWDIDFYTVSNSVSFGILKRFIRDNKQSISKVLYRRSSNANTHVKITFTMPLSTNDKYNIRGYLRDDPHRIRLDHARDLIDSHIFNLTIKNAHGASGTGRLWDFKIKEGYVGEAGEWIELYPVYKTK
jgi:hypothetical protein